MWRIAILLPLSLTFHLGTIVTVALPEPAAFFPLNGTSKTRELQNRSPPGVASNVVLAPGPDGNPDGSYELSMDEDSKITFPNDGRLNLTDSITMLGWVYITGSSGQLFWYQDPDISSFGVGLRFTANNLLFSVSEGAGSFAGDLAGIAFNTREAWVHLGLSYNSQTGISSLFVNGEFSSSSTRLLMLRTAGIDIVTNFEGRISQLWVFDEALTEDQVQVVFQGCAELDGNIITTVNCGNHGRDISITIDKIPDAEHWNGSESRWRLNQYENASCAPTFGACSVSYGPFIGSHCTSVRSTSDKFIYTFKINTTVDLENLLNLALDHSYLITCMYPRNGAANATFVTLGNFGDSATGTNALDFYMRLYTNDSYEEILTDVIYPGSPIHVRVGVAHHFGETLDLLLIKCFTSSDRDGNRQRNTLIDNNGCYLSVTTNYDCSTQTNETEDFQFEALRYANQSENHQVWLHCTVYACLPSSVCQTLCAGCSNRKRREAGHLSTDAIISYQLSSGPYRIVGREKDTTIKEVKDEPENLAQVIIITLMVSGVVAVAIICVTVIVVLRKRALTLTITQASASGKAFENQGFEATDFNNKI